MRLDSANKAFQRDVIAVSHLLQRTQKLRHGNSAPEQRRYVSPRAQPVNQKIYVVTKDKYLGRRRTLGFIRFQNDDLYYDFGSLKGSHNSYHRDGSEWRTSLATGGKARRQGVHVPLKNFKGIHNLGVVMFSKNLIPKLPATKDKYFKTGLLYEVDVESLPSDQFNMVIELMEAGFEIEATNLEMAYPPDALIKEFKETKPWLILTVLGYPHNLLVSATDKQTTVNHFNSRFTANGNSLSYSSELYAAKAYDLFGQET